MNFGDALAHLKDGKRVARAGWNGKGMWLVLVDTSGSASSGVWLMMFDMDGERKGLSLTVVDRDASTKDLHLLPWIGMKTADGGFVPWLASQTDILADDWVVL